MAGAVMELKQIERLYADVITLQNDEEVHRIPRSKTTDDRERKLGVRLAKVLIRRSKAVGKKPSKSVLNKDERDMINSIPGVDDWDIYHRHGVKRYRPKPDKSYHDINAEVDQDGQRPELPGSVQRHGSHSTNGWRLQVKIDGKTHGWTQPWTCVGPVRRYRVDAEADLREAKEAPTRDAMKVRIQEIKYRARATMREAAYVAEIEADEKSRQGECRV
jgi:hypothetical protein